MSQNRDKLAAEIGSAVRAELSRKGKSVASLAPVLGISKTSLYAKVRGTAVFDYAQLSGIANYLEIPVSQLVESAELGRAS